MLDEDVLRLGKGVVARGHIHHFALGRSHGVDVLLHQRVGLRVGGLQLRIVDDGVHAVVGVADADAGVGIEVIAAVPGIGPGLRIDVVRAPVALHDAVLAVAAGLGQEVLRGAGPQLADDVVRAEHALELLLDEDALVLPVGVAALVADDDLDGEGDLAFELGHGGLLVLQGLGLVIEVLGVVLESGQLREVRAAHGAEVRGGDGVLQKGLGIVRLQGADGVNAVHGAHDGVAEVLVVDGRGPVLGRVLLVIGGVEVEAVEVGPHAVRAGAGEVLRIVRLPVVHDVHGDVGSIDLVAQDHLRAKGRGLGVIGALDAVDVDLVRIPVVLVLDVEVVTLGLILGQDVGAAVVELVVGGAKVLAQLVQQRAVGREPRRVGQAGEEVGRGLLQGVLQGVVVQRLDADLGKVRDLLVVEGLGVLDAGDLAVCQGLVFRSHDVLQRVDEVVRGHFRDFIALVVVPLDALAQVEGPGQAVRGVFPAQRKAGDDVAVGVVLHEGVDDVGRHLLVPLLGSDQVVQRRDLRGVQVAVDHGFGGRAVGLVRPAGAAARRGGFCRLRRRRAGHERQRHAQTEDQGEKLFHLGFLLTKLK